MTRELTRRGALIAGASLLAGCLGDDEQTVAEPPDGPVANAPIPDDPDSYTYETMGDGETSVTATFVSNWKCPHCADFSTDFLGTLVSEYVEPGDVSIQHRALAYTSEGPWMGDDAPRAAEAGLAVWHTDPEAYWQYHEHVMTNQGDASETWATTDRLVGFAEDVGVDDPEAVRTAIDDRTYEQPVRSVATYVSEIGVSSTPTLVVDGTTNSALDESAVRDAFDDAVANA